MDQYLHATFVYPDHVKIFLTFVTIHFVILIHIKCEQYNPKITQWTNNVF